MTNLEYVMGKSISGKITSFSFFKVDGITPYFIDTGRILSKFPLYATKSWLAFEAPRGIENH
jgi:hypothetical protein